MKDTKFLSQALRGAAFGAVLSASLFVVSGAKAQNVSDQTRSADPSRVEDQIEIKPITPRIEAPVEIKELKIDGMPEGAQESTFTLSAIVLEGVSVYTDGELSEFYADKIGQTVSVADLYTMAAEITRFYRNNGYILAQVFVPAQDISGTGGAARLQIVEGYIDRVIVESVDGTESDNELSYIRGYAEHIKEAGGAMNVEDLERWLLLINDLPGVSARSVLSPSETKTGAADLRILVERDSFEGLVGVNNYGSRYLGPVQASLAGSFNSLLGFNEQITAHVVVAPDDRWRREMSYGSIRYHEPILDNGMTLDVFGSFSKTEPGHTLKPFDVRGYSRFAAVTLKYPVIRARAHNITVRGQFDYRNLDSNSNIPSPVHDDIRALRGGARFEYLDRLFGLAFSTIDLEVSKGLDVMDASDKGDPNLSRAQGEPQFFKLNANYQRLQRLTDEVNLLVGASGQWSDDALLSSEEMGVGGINSGRGYDPSEIIGDEGIAGKVEVQWKEPLEIPMFEEYQFFGFVDAGRVWNRDATTSKLKKDTIVSSGFGIRGDINEDLKADFMVTFPMNRSVEAQGDQDPRLYFNLSKKF
jgi:hemolysin activation/secretion protein